MSRNVIDAVEQLVEPILETEGLELYDTEYKKEGKNRFLRIYIDRPEGKVDLDDCSRVSEQISAELDRVNPVSGQYYLEVSSPGAERPLKKPLHFERAIGKRVFLTTYESIQGRKKFEGLLTQYTPESLMIELEDDSVEIPPDKVAKARLAVAFQSKGGE
ncbi:ribosome maturation factor RimP [Melghirimyces algeriensis]|uniref:Ribosome maturation factor RimP n=1 Tax=Melghirimyces algeriensis TaxID=910412 RepID=A0A521C2I1_9BACL|nr:ribosome maturation factor RimP [Melghirimyces algeriensis]SMO53686.1 ribosome maturation factor RimP [Melghirimyces algeriensis]